MGPASQKPAPQNVDNGIDVPGIEENRATDSSAAMRCRRAPMTIPGLKTGVSDGLSIARVTFAFFDDALCLVLMVMMKVMLHRYDMTG
jgi:hypothetical protein